MFPTSVQEAIPFVNDYPTNIELKINFPSSYRYSVITSGKDVSGTLVYNRTCLADMAFIISNSIVTHSSFQKKLKISAKASHRKLFPPSMGTFEEKAVQLFPFFEQFLNQFFPKEKRNIHLITLPALAVRPLVLAKAMCLFDQDWIETQFENLEFYLRQCYLHQVISVSLFPYSPPVRFISDGLLAFYTIKSINQTLDREYRFDQLFLQVLGDEDHHDTAITLFRDFQEDYIKDHRRTNKGKIKSHNCS